MDTIIKYLTQPSTWIGLISVLGAVGIHLNPDMTAAIVTFGVGAGGLILVLWDQHASQNKQ